MATCNDSDKIIDFWDSALKLSEEDKKEAYEYDKDDWKEMAPSEKLFLAAASLGNRKKVLDFGCGNAWAGIIAAKSGCNDVTAVDPAQGAVETAQIYADVFGAKDHMNIFCADINRLKETPANTYDGFICSNVIDVIPAEAAGEILRETARIVTEDASVIIGMNYYISPESAAEKGIELKDGNRLYVDGILRMVSRSDEEWSDIFGKYFKVERLEHFAWPGESDERRRLFYLKRN